MFKERAGCPGGGKGILCGVDKSFTLSTMVDQSVVYALQANGIDRAETAGCNGCGWREDQSYTLNTIDIDRHAVAYETVIIDRAAYNQGENAQYDPQYLEGGGGSNGDR